MMEMLLDVIEVEPLEDYRLRLVFENNEQRYFDVSQYLDEKPFIKLKDKSLFMAAKVAFGTVVWPGNIDIAPETLYSMAISR
jgi:hypothetical protein